MQVHKELGCGFLEKVHENAMMVLLREMTASAQYSKRRSRYCFAAKIIGEYVADILVEAKIILELKCANKISEHS